MKCDKCNAETKEKQITSKKNGKTYTVYECLGNCMNGQYKYSFFPKKTNGQSTQPLEEILKTLQDIRSLLTVQKGITVGQSDASFGQDELPNEQQPW